RVAQKPTTTPAKEPVPSPEPSKTVEKPVEKPVETYTPPPQPSTPVEKPVEQNPPTSGNPTGENRSGWATYYHPSEGLGACGKQHSDDELVVAVSAQVYAEFALTSPGDPNSSAACNTYLKCNWEGKSVRVKIVDKCFACNNGLNIDLSPAAFKLFGPLTTGKLEGMTWSI
ncbi:hypothetical protein EX30DRAFT_299676, partial [Ascodesmis nigricans]